MSRKQNSMKSALRAVAAAAVLGGASMGAMACGSEPYLGQVCYMAMPFCPEGTLVAAGQTLPIAQYQALYSLLGTYFGGDGRTNFNLPNLQGRMMVGTSSMLPLGTAAGSETVALKATDVPAHVHNVALQANGTVSVPALTTETAGAVSAPTATNNTVGKIGLGTAAFYPYSSAKAVPLPPATVTTTVAGPTTNQFNNAPTNQTPVSVINPRVAVTACIVVTNGLYPVRP